MAHDVITFGEAMIRLSPPNFRRLEQARSLDVQVGGAELNTAVGLARLGRSTAWVSRLTDNPLGRLIGNHAREAGVSTEHVVWTKDDRVGVYFLEFGAAPRASSVLYDRKGAAIAGIKPGMVTWASVFAGAQLVSRHRHHAGAERRPRPRLPAKPCRRPARPVSARAWT